MRALWRLILQHPIVAGAVAILWLATWAVIWATWTTGLEPWSIAVRFLFLLIPPALVAVAHLRRGEAQVVTREAVAAAVAVAVLDLLALFLPDLVAGIVEGGPWWAWAEVAIFVTIFAAVWIGVAYLVGVVGGAIGWWAASHLGRRPQPR